MVTQVYSEWFRKRVEQARTRAEAESKVSDLGEIIIEHLIKVLAFGPNCSSYRHWMVELDIWFRDIWSIKLKPKSYRPPLYDIKKWAHEEYITSEFDYKNFIDSALDIEWELGNPIGKELVEHSYVEFNSLYDSILAECANGKYSKEELYRIVEGWFSRYKEVYDR